MKNGSSKRYRKWILISIIILFSMFLLNAVCPLTDSRIPEQHRIEIKNFVKNNNYNETHCIVVDFSKHSGKCRYYLYNIESNKVVEFGIVAHGIGKNNECIFTPEFSNEIGSNLSCVGKFKLGKIRKTNFTFAGKHLDCIELHGLDKTNSNAYKRGILIHTGMYSDIQTFPFPCVPISQGCFTITRRMFYHTTDLMRYSDKPILLYAFK